MTLAKTNRMNALFDFYATLLTEKQMNYLELYYGDDLSLAEIADEYQVSRQAVYDNIKRTEIILEEYEKKLHLYSNFVVRGEVLQEMRVHCQTYYPEDEQLTKYLAILEGIEE